MRVACRIAAGLTLLLGMLVGAVPAYADDAALSVNSITFTPGAGEIRQTITYHNLPDHSRINYQINRGWGELNLLRSDGSVCAAVEYHASADCTELSGSGVIYAAFGNPSPYSTAFTTTGDVATVEVRVLSLSLLASATVTAKPKADLAIRFADGYQQAEIDIYNYGPSISGKETLTISGFTQVPHLPTGVCELADLVVRCYLRELATTTRPNSPSCRTAATGRYSRCYSFSLTVGPPATRPTLTATVTGPVPDPDGSNNSGTLVGYAVGNPPPAAGGPGGGTGGTGSTSDPGAIVGADASPTAALELELGQTAVPEPAAEAGAGTALATAANSEGTEPTPTLVIVLSGFLVGAAVGGAGLLAWRRFRPRPASVTGPDALVNEGPTGGSQ